MNRKQHRAAGKIHSSAAGPQEHKGASITEAEKGSAKALCLNMIVKNEMASLERCLTSVAPYIACWVICDTGSTDGTQSFIRSFFAARNIPGELHSFPFENFAQARNEALDRARASKLEFDYLLLTDADMEFIVQNPLFARDLSSAAYKVLQRSRVTYWNTRLLRRDAPAIYKGVTHEYLHILAGETKNTEGISFIDHGTGSNRADKYERDARLLSDALAAERDPGMIGRYTFYLANTLRDSGQKEAALQKYLKRAHVGGWQQEVYLSLLNAAEIKEELNYPAGEVIAAFEEATAACPTRAEALHGAAHFCRSKAIYETGYELAKKGLAIPYPNDGLFVRDWVYEYGLLDELAVCAYWTGRYKECMDICDRLLNKEKLPQEMRDRVLKNKNFAKDRLQERRDSTSPESEAFFKLLRIAREKEQLTCPDEEVIAAYEAASHACLSRAEALHGAARFCRNKALYQRGFEYATRGLAIPRPISGPSVEDWIYDYGLLDELAINAYWTGRYEACRDACARLLQENKIPANMQDRIKKNAEFAIEQIRLRDLPPAKPTSTWTPDTPSAGTELMVGGLRERLGAELDRINLQVNHPGTHKSDKRPRVVWIHHDVNQQWVQWCKEKELVDSVNCFVFISYWQRERYINTFGLPPQRCFVIRYALDMSPEMRRWEAGSVLRCAYASTPFRGLDVLLDAWERISPANAELHIWSSMKLYLEDDRPYQHLFAQAQCLPGVIYHGLVPNPELRAALRTMHFLTYPSTFAETACLTAIEAMSAGCRLIVPSLGALPETTAGYARVYPSNPNAEKHVTTFSENLAAELASPWDGDLELSLRQQAHCRAVYNWPTRLREWRHLIEWACNQMTGAKLLA